MSAGVSVRAYARARGVSHTAIQKAIKAGRVTLLASGKIDPTTADEQLSARSDPARRRAAIEGRPAPERPSLPMDPTAAGKYAASRAARESYLAAIAGLTYREKLGQLVPADQVRSLAFRTARRARDLLRTIPDRCAAVLAGTLETAEVHRLLLEEVDRVCAALRDDPLGETLTGAAETIPAFPESITGPSETNDDSGETTDTSDGDRR